MIDQDGFERPDRADEHMRPIKHEKRKVKFDENYHFRPRNPFFKLWCAFFRALAITILRPFFAIKYKVKIVGKEKLKALKHKPYIITTNHVHLFDDVIIGSNIFVYKKFYFVSLDRSVRRPWVGFWIRSLSGIAVPAESISGMKKFNEDVGYLLEKGHPVLYNPEGSMWPYYRKLRPFKRGAFVMAVAHKIPVLPITLTFRRKQKRNGKFKYYLTFTISDFVNPDETISDERKRANDLLIRTQETMQNVIDDFYANEACGFEKQE